MSQATTEERINQLAQELALLKAESQVRQVLGRYMFLCDVPLPEPGMNLEERAAAVGALFTEEGVWEGVGAAHGSQFGQHVGPRAIAAHMTRFFTLEPRQIFNTHYVCSEQIRAGVDKAEGNWVQFQPWVNDKGESLLRSSRLHVRFSKVAEDWKIAHYRTENLFIVDLPVNWTRSLIERSVLMA